MPIDELRKINGYVLASTVEPITLRDIGGYILIDQVKRPNLSISGKVGLLAAINKEKGVSFTANQLAFDPPLPVAGQPEINNTTIKVNAKKASGYSGSYTFTYTRYDLADAFNGQVLQLLEDVGSTVWGTLDAINAKFSIKLEQSDVADGPIAPNATSILLTVLDSSVYYIPGTTVSLSTAPDPEWMLFDVNTLTDLKGTGATGTLSNAVTDNSYFIDGEPSLKISGAGNLTINLATVFDSTIPEWTLEWSSRLNTSTTGYANLMQLRSPTTNTFAQRTSDSGFGFRIQQGNTFAAQTDAYNFPFGAAAKNGVLTRYAAVKKNGIITMFVDGVATNLARSVGTSYTVGGFPAGAGAANNDRIVIGLLAQNIGHIRLSKFARYTKNYTPKPFKVPSFASIAPVTDALGFDPA